MPIVNGLLVFLYTMYKRIEPRGMCSSFRNLLNCFFFSLSLFGWGVSFMSTKQKMELNTDADYIDEGTQVEDGNLMSDIRSRFKRGVTVRLTKKPPPPKRSDSAAI